MSLWELKVEADNTKELEVKLKALLCAFCSYTESIDNGTPILAGPHEFDRDAPKDQQ